VKELTEMKELEINKLKVEINQMKPLVKSLEAQNIKISELEKKLLTSTEQDSQNREKIRQLSEKLKKFDDQNKSGKYSGIIQDDEVNTANRSRLDDRDNLRDISKENINTKINFYKKSIDKKVTEVRSIE